MRGRLNIFQAAMLRWRDLHPYNAVHVMRIDSRLDGARLRATIDARLVDLGLTGLVLDASRARYEYRGGPVHAELRVLKSDGERLRVTCEEIERQLNEPFAADGRIDPFRFFAVDAGDHFSLGLAYDHFIAGGDSIALLMKSLLDGYADAGHRQSRPLELYPATTRGLFLRHPWRVLRGTRHLKDTIASGARAFRPRYPGGAEMRNGFVSMSVDAGELAALKATAKAWNVTQNDLVMAILLQILSPLTEERRDARRRREIAIASIINLRSEFGPAAASAFGQFLSSFHVAHPVPAGIGLERLARDVQVQSASARRDHRYFHTWFGMGVTRLVWPALSPERRVRFHAKSYPVWAGTTPLNVDALWKNVGVSTPVPEYLRGVSTGPLAPLVVAVTTAGCALHFGLSFRTAAFDRENVDRIATDIRHAIQSLPA